MPTASGEDAVVLVEIAGKLSCELLDGAVLEVPEHARDVVVLGVATVEEAAEAAGADVGAKTGRAAEAFGFELKDRARSASYLLEFNIDAQAAFSASNAVFDVNFVVDRQIGRPCRGRTAAKDRLHGRGQHARDVFLALGGEVVRFQQVVAELHQLVGMDYKRRQVLVSLRKSPRFAALIGEGHAAILIPRFPPGWHSRPATLGYGSIGAAASV